MTRPAAIIVALLLSLLVAECAVCCAGWVDRTREPACVGDAHLVPDRGDCTPWRMTEHGEERVCRLVCVRGSK